MCSVNNGSDDHSGAEGGGGLSQKSQKRQKVPKRGPGVAELEKILREQADQKTSLLSDHVHHEMVADQGRFNPSCFDFPMSRHFSYHMDVHHHQLPSINPSSCASSTFFGARSHHDVAPPITPVPSNYSGGSSTIGGGAFLPERAFFPVTWMADEGKSDGGISLPSSTRPVISNAGMKKKQYCHNITSMMNNLQGSASSLPNIPSSAGLCHQIEPPSSQRLCHSYPSIGPHEKIIGVKRPPPPPSVDNPLTNCHHQVPAVPPQRHGPDQPTSFNPNLTKPMPRDAKWDAPPLEFKDLQNYTTELYGAPNVNSFRFVPCDASLFPPFQSLQLQFPKIDHTIPIQGGRKETNQRSIVDGPDRNKPFYSFLPSKEQAKETSHGLNIERGEKDGKDDIDLNLKLFSS